MSRSVPKGQGVDHDGDATANGSTSAQTGTGVLERKVSGRLPLQTSSQEFRGSKFLSTARPRTLSYPD